ncbi:hypothetical protein GEM_1584 [Burkholderia cepacia GG4]|uniref:Uncharacterized protein n=1 Tax=Burkholderia cepacia GG4 TaxID=1009846 RepID=A0A9W3JZE9_BURCE|nr:hypothetical protein GEM_1584 [Burkholderia cepacia GG4]
MTARPDKSFVILIGGTRGIARRWATRVDGCFTFH